MPFVADTQEDPVQRRTSGFVPDPPAPTNWFDRLKTAASDVGQSVSDTAGSVVDKVLPAETYEGRPVVKNPDGSWSHERSMTIEAGGQHMNIPTMFGGKEVKPDQAVEILRRNNWIDPDTGKKIPTFKSQAEAVSAAQAKEAQQQNFTPPSRFDRATGAISENIVNPIQQAPGKIADRLGTAFNQEATDAGKLVSGVLQNPTVAKGIEYGLETASHAAPFPGLVRTAGEYLAGERIQPRSAGELANPMPDVISGSIKIATDAVRKYVSPEAAKLIEDTLTTAPFMPKGITTGLRQIPNLARYSRGVKAEPEATGFANARDVTPEAPRALPAPGEPVAAKPQTVEEIIRPKEVAPVQNGFVPDEAVKPGFTLEPVAPAIAEAPKAPPAPNGIQPRGFVPDEKPVEVKPPELPPGTQPLEARIAKLEADNAELRGQKIVADAPVTVTSGGEKALPTLPKSEMLAETAPKVPESATKPDISTVIPAKEAIEPAKAQTEPVVSAKDQNWKDSLVTKLTEQEIKDLSDAELTRALKNTTAPTKLVEVAKGLRDRGILTEADVGISTPDISMVKKAAPDRPIPSKNLSPEEIAAADEMRGILGAKKKPVSKSRSVKEILQSEGGSVRFEKPPPSATESAMSPKGGPGKESTETQTPKPAGGKPEIVLDDTLSPDVAGFYDDTTNKIHVSTKLSHERRAEIISHELEHARQAGQGSLPSSTYVPPDKSIKLFMEYFTDPSEVKARAAEKGEPVTDTWGAVFKLREQSMKGELGKAEPLVVEKVAPVKTTKYAPDRAIPDNQLTDWHTRRLTGGLRKNDPRPIEVEKKSVRVFFENQGNGIIAESMLRDAGIDASSNAPFSVDVPITGENLKALQGIFGSKLKSLPESFSPPSGGGQVSPESTPAKSRSLADILKSEKGSIRLGPLRMRDGKPVEAPTADEAKAAVDELTKPVSSMRLIRGGLTEESSKTLSKTMGPEGAELAKSSKAVRNDSELEASQAYQPIKAQLKKMGAKQRANLVEVLEGKSAPVDEAVKAAATATRIELNKVADRAAEVGLEIKNPVTGEKYPFQPRENFFPHMFGKEMGQIARDPKGRAMLKEKIKANLERAGKEIDEVAVEKALVTMIKASKTRYGHLEMARIADLGDYSKDAGAVLSRYFADAYRRVNIAEKFGPDLSGGENLLSQIGLNKGDKAESFARSYFQKVTSTEPEGNAVVKDAVRTATNFQAFSKLGQAVISNISQPAYTAIVAGAKNAAKGYGAAMTKEGRSFADKIILSDTMTDFLKDTGEHIDRSTMGKAADTVLKRTGFSAVERMNRIVSANAGKFFAEDTFEKLLKKPDSERLRYHLEKMNVDVEAALERGELSEKDLLRAGQNIINRTQFKTDVTEIPLFWASDAGRLLTQFKKFQFKAGQMMKDEVLGEMKRGNLKPFLRAAAILPIAGVLTVAAKDSVRFGEQTERDRNLADYLAAVGMFGAFTDAFAYSGRQPVKGLKYLAGPTLGDAGELWEAAAMVVHGQEERKRKETPSRFLPLGKFVARQVPVVGPSIRQLFNEPKKEKALPADLLKDLGLEKQRNDNKQMLKDLGLQ